MQDSNGIALKFVNALLGNFGSNENTNGLLRQYFPNEIGLSDYTQHDLDQVALRLSTRLRKTPGFQTPADTFGRTVALTA